MLTIVAAAALVLATLLAALLYRQWRRSQALAAQLPMFARFHTRLIAEAHLQQDQYEESPVALKAVALAPEPMVRNLGLIYRKDKALSKAALGFIQVVLEELGAFAKGTDRGDRAVVA